MEPHTEAGAGVWTARQCPFSIAYVTRVLDDIRLAVVDAFFSLPRGGAEIGGVLLGSETGGKVLIAGYEPLDCEHAFGPGFTLSDRDRARLTEMLAVVRPPELQVVGWYHSHTRSEIFLSDADLEIHNRYFPGPSQVALVMKPHTFQPTRAGFFFRDGEGAIHASTSFREFYLQPLNVRPAPPGEPAAEQNAPAAKALPAPEAAAETVTIAVAVEPAAPKTPEAPPAAVEKAPPKEPEVPRFLMQPAPRRRRWPKRLAAIAAGLALGAGGYWSYPFWGPPALTALSKWRSGSASAAVPTYPAAIGLNVLDYDGQLQIRWDRNSASVRDGANALLEILDNASVLRGVPLDQAHLQSGTFTYVRQGDRVDVSLAITQPGGKQIRESTTFLGRAPAGPADASDLRQQFEELTRQKTRIEADLKAETERNRKLERSLADSQAQLRRRLQNQIPK